MKLETILTALFIGILAYGCAEWSYGAFNLEPVVAEWLHPVGTQVAKK